MGRLLIAVILFIVGFLGAVWITALSTDRPVSELLSQDTLRRLLSGEDLTLKAADDAASGGEDGASADSLTSASPEDDADAEPATSLAGNGQDGETTQPQSEPDGETEEVEDAAVAETSGEGEPDNQDAANFVFDGIEENADGALAFSGTAPADTPVELLLGDEVIASGRAGPDGGFTLVPRRPLPAGEHRLSLRTQAPSGTAVVSPETLTVIVPQDDDADTTARVTNSATDEDRDIAVAAAPEPETSSDVSGETDIAVNDEEAADEEAASAAQSDSSAADEDGAAESGTVATDNADVDDSDGAIDTAAATANDADVADGSSGAEAEMGASTELKQAAPAADAAPAMDDPETSSGGDTAGDDAAASGETGSESAAPNTSGDDAAEQPESGSEGASASNTVAEDAAGVMANQAGQSMDQAAGTDESDGEAEAPSSGEDMAQAETPAPSGETGDTTEPSENAASANGSDSENTPSPEGASEAIQTMISNGEELDADAEVPEDLNRTDDQDNSASSAEVTDAGESDGSGDQTAETSPDSSAIETPADPETSDTPMAAPDEAAPAGDEADETVSPDETAAPTAKETQTPADDAAQSGSDMADDADASSDDAMSEDADAETPREASSGSEMVAEEPVLDNEMTLDEPMVPAMPTVFVVRNGDTLESLSRQLYGPDAQNADFVDVSTGEIVSAGDVRPGMKLRIPAEGPGGRKPDLEKLGSRLLANTDK